MFISDLLSPEKIHCDVHITSKKRLLERISEELARNSETLDKREIYESLCARERMGSTGLGKGVAIPHGRVKGSDHVEVSFMRLKKPMAFDAIDGKPVDLLFAMAVPEQCNEDHLKLLAQVAQLFSNNELLEKLREADTSGKMLQLLSSASH